MANGLHPQQAVLSLFDESDEADAAVLARHCDPHGRALYLYLEQEYPEKHRMGGNRLLADHGMQFRNDRDEWELTEAGEAWAEAMPYSRNGHSGYQILWNPAVAEQIREAA